MFTCTLNGLACRVREIQTSSSACVPRLQRHQSFATHYFSMPYVCGNLCLLMVHARSCRFVWGRSRLPLHDSGWSQPFTINLLTASAGNTADSMLPVSHTCFFSLDLPNYSNVEVMRAKISYAIANCQAIDADYTPNQSQMSAWADL